MWQLQARYSGFVRSPLPGANKRACTTAFALNYIARAIPSWPHNSDSARSRRPRTCADYELVDRLIPYYHCHLRALQWSGLSVSQRGQLVFTQEQIPWHQSSLFAAALAVLQNLSSPYGPVSSQERDPRLRATPFQICLVFSNTLNSPLSSDSKVWTSCPTCRTCTSHQHHHHDAGPTSFTPLPSLPYASRSCPMAPGP